MKYMLVFIISIAFLNAAEPPVVRESDSDKALMFELSSLDDQFINNYIYGLGYRWYFSDNWSLGIGVGFNSNNFDESIDSTTITNETLAWGLNPSLRYNFSSNKNIIGFIGVDLAYFTSSNINTIDSIDRKETSENYSAGVFVGADWFFTKNISLTAQYRLSYGIMTQENSLDDVL